MASFDIVSKVDIQSLDNAVNVARKEITTRWDFKDSKTQLELDKKNLKIQIITETDMRLSAVEDILRSRLIKQKINPLCLDFGKKEYASGNMIRKEISIRQGISKEVAKKIVKVIKDSGLKVQTQIMDDQIRVTGKQIDDLQAVIALCRQTDFGIPLQFDNMKR
jgi:uncharacterized protein YajQ (UPF0234 family)